jgi:hypothetical protein
MWYESGYIGMEKPKPADSTGSRLENLDLIIPRSDSPPSLYQSTPVTKMVLGTIQPLLQNTSSKHTDTETHLAEEGGLAAKSCDARVPFTLSISTRITFAFLIS